MVPLMAVGIPGSGATAVILGAFMLHGVQPGPQVLVTSADMVYAIFASIFLGVFVMCAVGYFAVRLLVEVLDIPEAIVSAFVMILCFMGALSIERHHRHVSDDRVRRRRLSVRAAGFRSRRWCSASSSDRSRKNPS